MLHLGVLDTLFESSSQTALPDIVDEKSLESANGSLRATQVVGGGMIGPPVGVFLFGVVVGLPFLVDGISYLVSAGLLATIVLKRRSASPGPEVAPRPPLLGQVLEGLKYVAKHRLIRGLLLIGSLLNLCLGLNQGLLAIYVVDELGASNTVYGLLLSALGVGGVVAGLATSRLSARFGSTRVLGMSLVIFAAGVVLVALFPTVAVAYVAMPMIGFATISWSVVHISLRQRIVPAALLGRVSSSALAIMWTVLPLGTALGGILAEMTGVLTTVQLAAAILIATAVLGNAWLYHMATSGAVGAES